MTRQQHFFGRLVAAIDLVVLFATFLAAYSVRLKLWELAYPVLPLGSLRSAAWIMTVIFPAWLFALRYLNLYNPVTYRLTPRVLSASLKRR